MRRYKNTNIVVPGVLKSLILFIPVIIVICFAIYQNYSPNSIFNEMKKKEILTNDYDKANAYFTVQEYQNALNVLSVYENNDDITPEMIILIKKCKDEIAELEESNIIAVLNQEDFAYAKVLLADAKYMSSNKKNDLIKIADEGLTNRYFNRFYNLDDIDEQISLIIEMKDLNLCGENKVEFEEMISNTISQYSNNIINNLTSFSSYEEKIEYLKKSNNYFKTDDITNTLFNIKEEYAKSIISEIDSIYIANDIEGVISYLENASRIVETNSDIKTELSHWKEKLNNKTEINKNNIKNNRLIMTSDAKSNVIDPIFYDDGVQDALGNSYSYGFAVVNNYHRTSCPGEAEFLLNKKYDYLRFTYAPMLAISTGGHPNLKVFVDDELVLAVPEFKDPYIDPVATVINVSGADRVRFRIPPGSFFTDGPNGGWLILEAELN